MKRAIEVLDCAASIVLLMLAARTTALAQNGKLIVHVTPEHAYIFVDGHALSEARKRHSFSLSAGDHKVEVVNYGYTQVSRTVTIESLVTTDLQVRLTPVSRSVSGPFGAITFEGAAHDAVLLNGKTPEFFVGHGDEFDHELWWKQELVVPPANYQVTVIRADKEIWSGSVDVPSNQRVIVDIPNGVCKTVAWSRGEKLSSSPRFTVGAASARIAVAKPTAKLSASAGQINCGDSSQLKWSSSEAPHLEIVPVGEVPASGEQAVQPKQSTTYQLTALGPGGIVTSSTTVNVNREIQTSLGFSPVQIRYKRVGDKVIEEGSAILTWTTENASFVSLNPLGTVDTTGSRSVKGAPQKTDAGPVDETVTYVLNAKNECGGAATQTATLRIVGTIEPPLELVMRSVYFPTDLPQSDDAKAGLPSSEQETLKSIADVFKRYLAVTPSARLTLSGHADVRGPDEYNQELSARRVQLVKAFMTEQGVPADAVDTQANGEEQNLNADQVKKMLEQDFDLSEEQRRRALARLHTLVLANDRRVDLTVAATGQQESVHQYSFNGKDVVRLIDRNVPRNATGVILVSKKKKVAN